jgi:hypothetical protein
MRRAVVQYGSSAGAIGRSFGRRRGAPAPTHSTWDVFRWCRTPTASRMAGSALADTRCVRPATARMSPAAPRRTHGQPVHSEPGGVGDAGDARVTSLLLRCGAGAASDRGPARVAHRHGSPAGGRGRHAHRLVVRADKSDHRRAARQLFRWSGSALLLWPDRRVEIRASNCPYLHVYAPFGRDFFCVEPQSAPAGALCRDAGEATVVPPGQRFELQVSFAVSEPRRSD